MKISSAAIFTAALLSPGQLAAADAFLQCDRSNDCYKAVNANANAPAGSRQPGCESFFRKTITPKPHSTVTTICVTIFKQSTTTTTQTSEVNQTTTTTSTQFNAATTVATTTSMTTATATVTTPTTITNSHTVTNTVTSTVQSTSTYTLPSAHKKRGPPSSCPTTSAGPSTLPAYASVCANTDAYSSACSCYGAKHSTTVIDACTTVSYTITTSTVTKSAHTATVTTAQTNIATATATTTVTTPTTVTSTATSTDTTTVTAASTVTQDTTTTTTTTSTSTSITTVTQTPVPTFSCSAYGYLIQRTKLLQMDLTTAQLILIKDPVSDGQLINAMGYNILDNKLYAMRADGAILQIGADGSSNEIQNIGITANAGVVDTDGYFWIATSGQVWTKIDMIPGSSTYAQVLDTGSSDPLGYFPYDWVYLPSSPGVIFSITSNGQNTALLSFDMTSHIWKIVTVYPNNVPTGIWGANYGTASGYIYALENTSGVLWKFNTLTGVATYVTKGATSTSNDGARCVLV